MVLANVNVQFTRATSASDVFVRGTDDKFFRYLALVDALAGFAAPGGAGDGDTKVQFTSEVGLGRVGLGGMLVGGVFGVHATLASFVLLTGWGAGAGGDGGAGPGGRSHALVLRWCGYALSMALFHACEFLSTARFKPRTATFDSFLLNHSTAYQAHPRAPTSCVCSTSFFFKPRGALTNRMPVARARSRSRASPAGLSFGSASLWVRPPTRTGPLSCERGVR